MSSSEQEYAIQADEDERRELAQWVWRMSVEAEMEAIEQEIEEHATHHHAN